MKFEIVPLRDRVVVTKVDDINPDKIGSIYLPQSHENKKSNMIFAKVHAVGPGIYEGGVLVKPDCAPGDILAINRYSADFFELRDHEAVDYIVISGKDAWVKLIPKSNAEEPAAAS